MTGGFKTFILTAAAFFAAVSASAAAAPKYVFLLIGDGMSVPQRMVAGEFSRKVYGRTLAMNHMPFTAMTRTCSADSLITDSAAAATAIACGQKTNNHFSGVDPDGKPLESCAVLAKRAGKKVGIVTTVTITHATPAGFYAHRQSRGDIEGIAADLAASGFDLFAGGGLEVDRHKSQAYENAEKAGYRIVRKRDEFLALKPAEGARILTRFTNGPLSAAIDRDAAVAEKQPTLAELVTKSIELLDGEAGFFLMAEGGRIDWAGHSNDAATNLRDVLAFDEAVEVALDFQKRHPDETLVVVTGDHETGGLSMGFAGTGYSLYVERLAHQKMSVEKFGEGVQRFFAADLPRTFDDFKPLVEDAFGLKFAGEDAMTLTVAEADSIRGAFDHDLAFALARKAGAEEQFAGEKRMTLPDVCRLTLAHKSGLGWSSGAHTAMPVMTTAIGVGAENFNGFIENTDIARILKSFYP